MVFIGYEYGSKAYRLWNPKTCSVVVSATVCFDKQIFPNRKDTPRHSPKPKQTPSREPELHPEGLEIPWSFFDDMEDPPKPPHQKPPSPPLSPLTSPSPSESDSEEQVADQLAPINRPPDNNPPPNPPMSPPKERHPRRSDPPTPSKEPSPPPLTERHQRSLNPEASGEEPRCSGQKRTQVEKYVAGSSGLGTTKSEGDFTEQDAAYLSAVELCMSAYSSNEPMSHTEAMKSDESELWTKAEKEC